MLAPQSQVILRNAELFAHGKWLLVNAPERSILREFPSDYVCWQQTIDQHKQDIENEIFSSYLADTSRIPGAERALNELTGAVVYMPKNKAQLQCILHRVASLLSPGQHIALVGHNKEGIKSADKVLTPFCTSVNKVDSAKHCALLVGMVKDDISPFLIEDYFSSQTYELESVKWHVVGLPGVFSQARIDDGSAFLLHNLPGKLSGNVLDFACGAGVIGAYIKQVMPDATLTLCDNSAIAINASQRTLELNGLDAQVIASNGLNKIDGQFQHIISNPPFHTGVKTDYGIADKFIERSYEHLTKGGEIRIVANRFLPYPDILEARFGNVQTIAQNNKFSVYASIKR